MFNNISSIQRNKFIQSKNAKRSYEILFSEAIIKYILCLYYHIPINRINIKFDILGKPYLNITGVHFNLSHSNNLLVCAVSQIPIGVDIEYINKNIDLRRSSRFFSKIEKQYIYNSSDKFSVFFLLWTIKESYLKLKGSGLIFPLPLVTFDYSKTTENKYKLHSSYHFNSFVFEKNFLISICTDQKRSLKTFNLISSKNILMFFSKEL